MLALINNTLLQVVFALTFSVPGFSGFLQGISLDEIQQEYQKAIGDRGQLLEAIEDLESRHHRLSARITELKRDDVSRLTVRLALEDLLRQSQEISNDLERLHQRVHALDNKLSGQRTQLAGGVEERMQELEQSLMSARSADRKGIVGQLNELRAQRRSYAKPLPAVPSLGQMDDTMNLATQAETPDELMAAADELLDTEDQVRRRLNAISDRLEELKQNQRLLRRARTFSKEERFFEETDRGRVIARYSRTKVTRSVNNQNSPTEGEGILNAGEDSQDNAVFSGNNAVFSGNNDNFEAAPLADHDVAPAPSEPSLNQESVFDTVQEHVFINSNDDPQRAFRGAMPSSDDSSLETQIGTLESEKTRLERQAKALKRRAKALRRKADNL